jgi:hypothetical protein
VASYGSYFRKRKKEKEKKSLRLQKYASVKKIAVLLWKMWRGVPLSVVCPGWIIAIGNRSKSTHSIGRSKG